MRYFGWPSYTALRDLCWTENAMEHNGTTKIEGKKPDMSTTEAENNESAPLNVTGELQPCYIIMIQNK